MKHITDTRVFYRDGTKDQKRILVKAIRGVYPNQVPIRDIINGEHCLFVDARGVITAVGFVLPKPPKRELT